MKKLVSIILSLILVLSIGATLAEPVFRYEDNYRYNPNTNVDDPSSMPYSGNFSILEYTATKTIKPSSDGRIVVNVNNAKVSVNKNIRVKVQVYHSPTPKGDSYVWQATSAQYVLLNNTPNYFKLNFSIPTGKKFYVRISKPYHKTERITGTLKITD